MFVFDFFFLIYKQESEFNLEESSLQALSNSFTLTRGEKIHSPHTSPRMSRKMTGINVDKEINVSTSKVLNNGKSSYKPPLVATSNNSSSSSSSGSSSATSSTSSSNTSISKVPLIDLSSNESSRASMNVKDHDEAPPIPPRSKPSSSNSSNIESNRPKPQQIIATPTTTTTAQTSTEKIPEIPEYKPKKSFSPPIATLDESESDDDEDPICGPAETITGLKLTNIGILI
jgi:hypothetical protein